MMKIDPYSIIKVNQKMVHVCFICIIFPYRILNDRSLCEQFRVFFYVIKFLMKVIYLFFHAYLLHWPWVCNPLICTCLENLCVWFFSSLYHFYSMYLKSNFLFNLGWSGSVSTKQAKYNEGCSKLNYLLAEVL